MMSTPKFYSVDNARESLIDQILSAASLREIAAVSQALGQWLVDHPDEPGMADGFELLSHREDSAREREVGCAHAVEPPAPSLTHA